jgi:hypothetical protein
MTSFDAFISYSTDDKKIADAVTARLESQGVRCWIAPRDVLPGQSWGGAIVGAIEQSTTMVVIFSAKSNDSRQVMREIERAVHRGITIIPFRVENVMPSKDLEYFISSCHWLDAVTPPLDTHIDVLAKALQRYIAPKNTSACLIPEQFLGHVQSGTKLKLEPNNEAGEKTAAAIHLVARKEFRLGRSRQDADYLAWFWPRSTENDERTKRLSKVHVIAQVRGERLTLRDAGSANRSTFEGQPLGEAGSIAITERGTLILGNEYHVEATPFESALDGELQIANEQMWGGPPNPPKSAVRGAVRFLPVNSEIALYNSVWILSDATFGRGRSNAVVIDVPDAAEVEGRFYYYRSNFWVETLPTGRGITVDNYKLRQRDVVPLVSGATVIIGNHSFRTTVEP